jgi:hypothetical protein
LRNEKPDSSGLCPIFAVVKEEKFKKWYPRGWNELLKSSRAEICFVDLVNGP